MLATAFLTPDFSATEGIAIAADGSIYLAGYDNNLFGYGVQKFAANGSSLGAFLTPDFSPSGGLALDGSGSIYLTGSNANSVYGVKKFSAVGGLEDAYFDSSAFFNGVAVRNNSVYLTDGSANRLVVLASSTAVPEPSGFVGTLVAGGCVLVCVRLRRGRGKELRE